MTLKHIYLTKHNDKNSIKGLISKYEGLNKEQIIDLCRGTVRTGIVGSHSQALHLIALNYVSAKVLGKSPIKIEDNYIISISQANFDDFN